ncbi:IclR family transcriptional regulator [Nocardia sp. NPDC052254]|uniref:IclR family transcriptional regulator n=1 Tax=Nocardia sp. NPDC052254 TaxID=3155681 RepID=UPI003416D106
MTAVQMESMVSEMPPRAPRPGVVERLTLILDAFSVDTEILRLEDITRGTGLPRSTAFRLLTQLVDLHWLEHTSAGYRLGIRLQGIGGRGADHSELRSAASGFLNDLHLRTGAVAHLTVLEGRSVHFLDKVGGAASSRVPSQVAARLPAARTVSGRALLACLEPEQVDRLMAMGSRRAGEPGSALHAQLNRIRRHRGISYAPGDRCPLRISAVAAPIHGPAGAVAAISLASTGVVELERLAPLVFAAARRTGRALFPERPERRLVSVRSG